MSFIRAFGAYLPETMITNDQLASRLGCEAEWIFTASGIRERRQAGVDETLVEMAARAGRACLEHADLNPDQIGMVIMSTGSAPRRFPGPVAETASKLSLPAGVATLDVPMASAGTLFAMALADQLAVRYGNILVLGVEKMTEIAWREPADPNMAILFGDGAGACLISPNSGIAEIVDHTLQSDGSFTRDLRLEHDGTLYMEGRSVILQASRKIPAAIMLLLERHKWSAAEINVLLMHQANQNLMNRVAQAVGMAQDRVFSVIEKTGNTSSASMLIAAAEWTQEQTSLLGKRIAFAAFGAGFHWGALLARGV
ncbi:MAG: ketoacyl-ACP synthase III [Acidobacteria bacterium]|nr:ketoacyl-ACP synthase III [Acidobacteriota bacterium]